MNQAKQEGRRLFDLGYLALPCWPGAKGVRRDRWNKIKMPPNQDRYNIEVWYKYDTNKPWDLAITCNTNIVIVDVDNEWPKDAYGNVITDGYMLDETTGKPVLADKLMAWLGRKIDLVNVPKSQTRKGGYHLYFSGRGVDWTHYKQATRLVHPTEGKLLLDTRTPLCGCAMEYPTPGYKWLVPLPPIDELPSVPSILLDWMPMREVVADSLDDDAINIDRLSLSNPYAPRLIECTIRYIESDPKCAMTEGSRNHNLLRVAHIAYWGAGLDAEITYRILEHHATRSAYYDPYQIKERLRATMNWMPDKKGFIGFLRRRLGIPITIDNNNKVNKETVNG